MSHCGVDFRLGRIFLTIPRWSRQEFQLMVFFGEAPSLEPAVVGAEVRRALETVQLEGDKTWRTRKLDAQSARLHEVAGTKGWSEYVRGTAHAVVEDVGGEHELVVIPSVNAGSRDGFLHLKEDEWLRLTSPSDAELGEAVLKGLVRGGAALEDHRP